MRKKGRVSRDVCLGHEHETIRERAVAQRAFQLIADTICTIEITCTTQLTTLSKELFHAFDVDGCGVASLAHVAVLTKPAAVALPAIRIAAISAAAAAICRDSPLHVSVIQLHAMLIPELIAHGVCAIEVTLAAKFSPLSNQTFNARNIDLSHVTKSPLVGGTIALIVAAPTTSRVASTTTTTAVVATTTTIIIASTATVIVATTATVVVAISAIACSAASSTISASAVAVIIAPSVIAHENVNATNMTDDWFHRKPTVVDGWQR